MEAWAARAENLSSGASSKRLRGGVVLLGIALMIAVTLVHTGVHPAWRLLLFLPFWAAAQGFYQGLYRT